MADPDGPEPGGRIERRGPSSVASRRNAHAISGSVTHRSARRTGGVHSSVTATAATSVTTISPPRVLSQAFVSKTCP